MEPSLRSAQSEPADPEGCPEPCRARSGPLFDGLLRPPQLAFDAARRGKSVFGRERQSDRAPQGSSFTIRSRPASGVASRKAPARRARSRVSNFEQTGEAGAGNCRTDGRVAQSAERVREQHETVVRNHSPAAISLASGRERSHAHGRSGNEPTRPLPRLMECGGPCGPRGK